MLLSVVNCMLVVDLVTNNHLSVGDCYVVVDLGSWFY